MWEELGISGGTGIILMIAGYFIIKNAVKNGIKQAYQDIKDKETQDDTEDDIAENSTVED